MYLHLFLFRVSWEDPVSIDLGSGLKLFSTKPPGSGALLGFILNVLQNYNIQVPQWEILLNILTKEIITKKANTNRYHFTVFIANINILTAPETKHQIKLLFFSKYLKKIHCAGILKRNHYYYIESQKPSNLLMDNVAT